MNKFKDNYLKEQREILGVINSAAAKIQKETGQNKKVNILLSSFVPNISKNKELTEFFIETQKKDFEEGNYQHLNLIGFYYYQEEVYTEKTSIDTSVLEGGDDLGAQIYFNDYVHSLSGNYKTMWIPYYEWSERNHLDGYDYGFDYVNYQSSYYSKKDDYFEDYNTSYGTGRRGKAEEIASENQYGVEVEFDNRLFSSAEYYNRYIEFLKTGVSKGWNKQLNVFYDSHSLITASGSKNNQDRDIYDLTYKYAIGTIQSDDLKDKKFSIEYPGKYKLISKGKKTALDKGLFAGSTCTGNNAYCDVDGTELTDGMYGIDLADWVLFSKNNTKEDFYEIVIDLTKTETSLSYFGLEMILNHSWGIGIPKNVEFQYSNNGTDYKKIGDAIYYNSAHGEKAYAYLELKKAIEARYIKAVFDIGDKVFVGLTEFTVGKTATINLESSSGTINLTKPNLNVKISTKDVDALIVTSNNKDIATCTISNNILTVNGHSAGTAKCEVKDSLYGVSELYTVTVIDDRQQNTNKNEYVNETVDNPKTGLNTIYITCIICAILSVLILKIANKKRSI